MRDVQYEVIPAICGSGPPPVNIATSGIHQIIYQTKRQNPLSYLQIRYTWLSQTHAGNPMYKFHIHRTCSTAV
jgi:hypothetical protein